MQRIFVLVWEFSHAFASTRSKCLANVFDKNKINIHGILLGGRKVMFYLLISNPGCIKL